MNKVFVLLFLLLVPSVVAQGGGGGGAIYVPPCEQTCTDSYYYCNSANDCVRNHTKYISLLESADGKCIETFGYGETTTDCQDFWIETHQKSISNNLRIIRLNLLMIAIILGLTCLVMYYKRKGG